MKESGAVVTDDGDDEWEEDKEEEGEDDRSSCITKPHGRFLRKHIPCLWERTASSECIQEDQTSHQSRIVIRSSDFLHPSLIRIERQRHIAPQIIRVSATKHPKHPKHPQHSYPSPQIAQNPFLVDFLSNARFKQTPCALTLKTKITSRADRQHQIVPWIVPRMSFTMR